ncbi:hypothetical protein SAMN05421684_3203 [Asanoa ishikariensis]|uniref:Lipoprotein n=1 Tax=Asanoa ishikariensis TaxID=137265 RepID=A0A1H3QUU6_9ACTN|nr:hypothetical protein [Asanoa ishikariensis]SDZ17100.1 hypothetical protein SAMN05421684_3203 [Asanoa ishikariensis]
MRLHRVFQVGLVIAAGALALGCTSTVDRQAAAPPASPGMTAASPQAAPPSASVAPSATSVPGTEMTPPADRNVCGRVRTATTDYSRSYDNAVQTDKEMIGKKWSGFIRERAKEATDPKLKGDLTKVADEVARWRPGQPDLRAYTSLLNTACARWGV